MSTMINSWWTWPDRTIDERESRRLRELHNRLCTSHAELLEACENLLLRAQAMDWGPDELEEARKAIERAHA